MTCRNPFRPGRLAAGLLGAALLAIGGLSPGPAGAQGVDQRSVTGSQAAPAPPPPGPARATPIPTGPRAGYPTPQQQAERLELNRRWRGSAQPIRPHRPGRPAVRRAY